MRTELSLHPEEDTPWLIYYARWSKHEQATGDSQRRQDQRAQKYASDQGLVFKECIRDDGLSAFSGAHRNKGGMAGLLQRAEAGEIPKGSVIFVEDIDRLSRESMLTALDMILLGFLKRGIKIATPDCTYDEQSISNGAIWRLIGKLENAHSESKKKSLRLKSVCEDKRQRMRRNEHVSQRMPAWLKMENGVAVVIPEARAAIEMIFSLMPTLGQTRLVTKLNAESPWMPPGRKGRRSAGWRKSYIFKILTSRAVIGEFQPHVLVAGKRVPSGEAISAYYPAVIAPEVFRAVQEIIKSNKGSGGRTGRANNIFKNVVHCAYCGGSMAFIDKGPLPKGGRYLVCDNGRRGVRNEGRPVCSSYSIRYNEVQDTVLENCRRLAPAMILPDPKHQAILCKNIRTKQRALENEHKELASKIERGTQLSLEKQHPTALAELNKQLHVHGVRLTEIESERGQLVRQLVEAERDSRSFAIWQKDLSRLSEFIRAEDAVEARMQLQRHIKDLIQRVDIYAVGHFAEYEPQRRQRIATPNKVASPSQSRAYRSAKGALHDDKGDAIGEFVNAILDSNKLTKDEKKDLQQFAKFVLARRMSKEGRFIRVYFRTGSVVNLVPTGSIASGVRLENTGANPKWASISPDLSDLWEEYRAAQYRARRKSAA